MTDRTQVTQDQFERYQKIICAIARASNIQADMQDDIVQTTMARVVEAYNPDGGRLTSYVMAVARGKVADLLRRLSHHPPSIYTQLGPEEQPGDLAPLESPGPRTLVVMKEERRVLAEALGRLEQTLDDRDRRILSMRFEHGMKLRQIAEELGLKTHEVHTVLQRITRQLGASLGTYYQTILADPEKFRALDQVLENLSEFYRKPFMLRHVEKMSIAGIVERIRQEEPKVTETHIQERLKACYGMIPSINTVGIQGWNRVKSLLQIDPKTDWCD